MSFKLKKKKKQWKVMKYQADKTIKCVFELLKKPQYAQNKGFIVILYKLCWVAVQIFHGN